MTVETTIYLVRHAHAEWRDDDSRPLSNAGSEAAAVLADRLASRPIAAVYTSPSRRSVETVAALADRLRLRPEVVADYQVVFSGTEFRAVERLWDAAPP
jgi:broad specificity phosphatase PhoE